MENTTKINITISPEILTKIKEGNYNRNALLVSLLKKHVAKQIK
jgi:hypothetical protein